MATNLLWLRAAAALAVSFALATMPTQAGAQPRPSTPAMTCRAAENLVTASGAIVLGTGPHTYERFVRDQSFCDRFQTTEPAYAATADSPLCFIAYRCKDSMRDESGAVR